MESKQVGRKGCARFRNIRLHTDGLRQKRIRFLVFALSDIDQPQQLIDFKVAGIRLCQRHKFALRVAITLRSVSRERTQKSPLYLLVRLARISRRSRSLLGRQRHPDLRI
jgi:hypothetical protein